MFKRMVKTLVIVGLVALTLGSVPALAEDESPVSASGDIGIFSQYVWRGYGLSDDSIVVQPSVAVSYKGFSFNLWGNLDTDSPSSFNETDMTFSYDWSAGIFGFGVGYIYYGLVGADAEVIEPVYPETEYTAEASEAGDSQELYVSISLDTILAPSLTVYRDFDEFDGWYISLGAGHSFELSDSLTLDLSAAIGFYDLDDSDYSELHDGSISASMTWAANEYISITPSLAYTFGLSSDAKDDIEANGDGDANHFFGGVTCSIGF